MRTQYDQGDVQRLIDQLADSIAQSFSPDKPLIIVGIRTRGEILASRLAQRFGDKGFKQIGRGTLDITLYRDDLSEIGPRPLVRPTDLKIDINAKPLLLVDDVFFTGRSVRAALNALIDFGRPSVIRLAVLVERPGRELPIRPDYVALQFQSVQPDHRINVRLTEIDGKDEIVAEPR
jgi:pyrimidine operon attenuation protein/uracil phosphoribosyltransferase